MLSFLDWLRVDGFASQYVLSSYNRWRPSVRCPIFLFFCNDDGHFWRVDNSDAKKMIWRGLFNTPCHLRAVLVCFLWQWLDHDRISLYGTEHHGRLTPRKYSLILRHFRFWWISFRCFFVLCSIVAQQPHNCFVSKPLDDLDFMTIIGNDLPVVCFNSFDSFADKCRSKDQLGFQLCVNAKNCCCDVPANSDLKACDGFNRESHVACVLTLARTSCILSSQSVIITSFLIKYWPVSVPRIPVTISDSSWLVDIVVVK